jgi:hypothetical protein
MTMGSSFRLRFKGTQLSLILSLSAILLGSQCLTFQPVHSLTYWCLLAWSILGISFMLIHRAKLVLFLPLTVYSRRLFCIISSPLFVGVSLFWRELSFLYALVMRMPFCLCRHILNTMLAMRDDHATGLPLACWSRRSVFRLWQTSLLSP